MGRILLYCFLGQILPAFLLFAEEKRRMRAALILKSLSSLYFVLLGLFLMKNCPDLRYARCVLAGLILGMIGDVLLNLCHLIKENRPVFLLGGTVFFAGHILYLAALFPLTANHLSVWLFTLLILVPVLFYVLIRTSGDLPFRLLVSLYLFAVILMTAASLEYLLESPELRQARLMFAGALFFLLSDTFLCKNMLNHGRFRWMRFALMILYYLGQTLIALSIASQIPPL